MKVDPESRSIREALTVTARALERLGHLVLDLDDRLKVTRTESDGKEVAFRHKGGMISVALSRWVRPRDRFKVSVHYGGNRAFPMPVPVKVGDRIERVEMKEGQGRIEIPEGRSHAVDPDQWVLRK